jgi:hypothetical protein
MAHHAIVLVSVPLVLCAAGCEEYGPRIYTAHPYRAGDTCLERSVPLGVVKAAELAATCEPVCLLLDEAMYVSRVCPPLPGRAIELAAEPGSDCASAASLARARAFCASAPPAPDAGAPGGSALDGGPDDAGPSAP